MVDEDGEIRYADIVALRYEAPVQVLLYPVPAVHHIVVQHPSALESDQIMIFNAEGRLIYSTRINEETNITTIQLDESDSGVHILRYVSKHESQSHIFLIQ